MGAAPGPPAAGDSASPPAPASTQLDFDNLYPPPAGGEEEVSRARGKPEPGEARAPVIVVGSIMPAIEPGGDALLARIVGGDYE